MSGQSKARIIDAVHAYKQDLPMDNADFLRLRVDPDSKISIPTSVKMTPENANVYGLVDFAFLAEDGKIDFKDQAKAEARMAAFAAAFERCAARLMMSILEKGRSEGTNPSIHLGKIIVNQTYLLRVMSTEFMNKWVCEEMDKMLKQLNIRLVKKCVGYIVEMASTALEADGGKIGAGQMVFISETITGAMTAAKGAKQDYTYERLLVDFPFIEKEIKELKTYGKSKGWCRDCAEDSDDKAGKHHEQLAQILIKNNEHLNVIVQQVLQSQMIQK